MITEDSKIIATMIDPSCVLHNNVGAVAESKAAEKRGMKCA